VFYFLVGILNLIALLAIVCLYLLVGVFTQELAQDCVRIARFKTFGDYLCGIQNPLLLYNVDTNHYESLYRRPSLLESQLSRQLTISDNFADVPVS
jgi:hypothetical protein